ncbi:MAG: hypothetical protein MASP_00534 [Candidatus Methanolliviera sp. GoM_asphalt]|nr:MAG: hypothetical protein MASP_00534 [Candidatus Methanolliviera sp. GoM_asphalt]
MMEQIAMGELGFGIWGLALVWLFMLIFLMLPLVIFAIILWKIRSIGRANMEEWKGQFETIFKEHQDEAKRFINNLNSMIETWISSQRERKKKER